MDMASVAGNYISETFFCSSVLSALTEIESSRRRWTILYIVCRLVTFFLCDVIFRS